MYLGAWWNVSAKSPSADRLRLGTGVRIGFEAEPNHAPHVGQTFYARVIFGMVSGCADPQHATIEIVPPSGAALRIDAAHDCLIAVVHVADGYRDPWLLAHQNVVVVK